jgi:hypothetical protein
MLELEFNDLSDKLFDAFPTEVVVGSNKFKGRNISPEELEKTIQEKILKGRIKGTDFPFILESLKTQADNGEVGMALRNWVETEQWLSNIKTIEGGKDL